MFQLSLELNQNRKRIEVGLGWSQKAQSLRLNNVGKCETLSGIFLTWGGSCSKSTMLCRWWTKQDLCVYNNYKTRQDKTRQDKITLRVRGFSIWSQNKLNIEPSFGIYHYSSSQCPCPCLLSIFLILFYLLFNFSVIVFVLHMFLTGPV